MTVTLNHPITPPLDLARLLDLDDLVDFIPELRLPDVFDTVELTRTWIGADAAIVVPLERVDELPYLIDSAGWLARTGRTPADFGITVAPYSDSYRHPAEPSKGHPAYRAWRLFTDTLLED